MNIGKILANVGTSAIKALVPGSGIVIDAVNAFLPTDKKLPADATGTQAMEAINGLPPEEQAKVLSKQCDVEMAAIQGHTDVIKALSQADVAGQSTRPYIAKAMCFVVCYTVISLNTAIFYAIVTSKHEVLKAIGEAWPLILAILGTPTALLKAYFGMRTEEKKTRANAALGVPVTLATGGFLSGVKKLFS